MTGVSTGPVDAELAAPLRLHEPSRAGALRARPGSARAVPDRPGCSCTSTVYFHRTVRAIDLDLEEVFAPSIRAIHGEGNPLDDLGAYVALEEYALLHQASLWAAGASLDPSPSAGSGRVTPEVGRLWRGILLRNPSWHAVAESAPRLPVRRHARGCRGRAARCAAGLPRRCRLDRWRRRRRIRARHPHRPGRSRRAAAEPTPRPRQPGSSRDATARSMRRSSTTCCSGCPRSSSPVAPTSAHRRPPTDRSERSSGVESGAWPTPPVPSSFGTRASVPCRGSTAFDSTLPTTSCRSGGAVQMETGRCRRRAALLGLRLVRWPGHPGATSRSGRMSWRAGGSSTSASGSGLCGIAAMQAGASAVTATDIDPFAAAQHPAQRPGQPPAA